MLKCEGNSTGKKLYGWMFVQTLDNVNFSWQINLQGSGGQIIGKVTPPEWKKQYTTRKGAVRAARRVMKQLDIQPRD